VERSETFYPWLCEILISFVLVLWSDKRSFSIFVEDKSYLSEGLRAYLSYR